MLVTFLCELQVGTSERPSIRLIIISSLLHGQCQSVNQRRWRSAICKKVGDTVIMYIQYSDTGTVLVLDPASLRS